MKRNIYLFISYTTYCLVRGEVERYRLEIVGLTSTHSLGSEPSSWRGAGPSTTLELPAVRGGGWCGLIAPAQLHVLEFTPVNERVSSLSLQERGLLLLFVPQAKYQYRVPDLLGVSRRG